MNEELKSVKKVYKKLLPNKSNASSIVTKMAESAMMSKCFAEKMFPSKGLKFSRGYSKAVDRLQQMSNSPAYSLWYAGWESGDEPTVLSLNDNHVSQARKIDFTGSVNNLRNQELPTYSNATNRNYEDDEKKSRSTGILPYEGGFDKALLNSELNLDSSGLPIFTLSGKSPTFNFSSSQSEHDSDINLPSCMSSTKHSRSKQYKNLRVKKDSRFETFDNES